jgi:hypothetical protein
MMKSFPNSPQRLAPLWLEFQPQWNSRVANWASHFITRRLNAMEREVTSLSARIEPLAEEVMNIIDKLRTQAQDDIHF